MFIIIIFFFFFFSEPDLDSSLCDDDELFLRFEPPISSSDYLYGLEPDEGLGDLFGLNSSFI